MRKLMVKLGEKASQYGKINFYRTEIICNDKKNLIVMKLSKMMLEGELKFITGDVVRVGVTLIHAF